MKPLQYIEFNELAFTCRLSHDELTELLEYGVIPLENQHSDGLRIPVGWIAPLQKAAQIRRDYALDLFTMGILVNYIQKIADLENVNFKLRTEVAQCSR